MSLKNKIVEIAYSLKDKFTGSVSKITGSMRNIEKASDKSSDQIVRNNKRTAGSFSRMATQATSATRKIKRVGTALLGVFGISLGGAGLAFAKFTADVDKLAKTARKLGITTQALSQLGHAAELTGVTSTQLALGLQRMTRRVAEAAQGSGEAVKALNELGLSAAELTKLSPDEQFKRIADAMKNVASQSDKVRLGFKLFDSEGVALINTMEGGSEAIEGMMKEADRLGKTIDEKTAKSIEEFNDALVRLKASATGLGITMGGPVVDAMNSFFDAIGYGAKKSDIPSINKELDGLANRIERIQDKPDWLPGVTPEWKASKIRELRQQILDLIDSRNKLERIEFKSRSNAQLEQKAANDKNQAAAKMKGILDNETEDLKKALKEREKAYRDHLSKLKSLQDQQKSVDQEFADLADEMRSDKEPDKEPELTDIQDLRAQGKQQIAAGDFEGAIESARKAGELLREMKEEGSESNLVLAGTAELLRQMANEASQGKTDKGLLDADASKAEIDELKAKIEEIKTELAALKQLGNENVVELKVVVNTDDIVAQVQAANEQAQAAAKTVVFKTATESGQTSFSDGTGYNDFANTVEREVLARGSK